MKAQTRIIRTGIKWSYIKDFRGKKKKCRESNRDLIWGDGDKNRRDNSDLSFPSRKIRMLKGILY